MVKIIKKSVKDETIRYSVLGMLTMRDHDSATGLSKIAGERRKSQVIVLAVPLETGLFVLRERSGATNASDAIQTDVQPLTLQTMYEGVISWRYIISYNTFFVQFYRLKTRTALIQKQG